MSDIQVRQAVLADLDALAGLFDGYRQFYGQPSDLPAARDFLLRRFEHGESILFIAHTDLEVLGFVQLYPMFSSVSLARIFVLNDLFVGAGARGRGVGRQLLDAATRCALELGAVRVMLETTEDNREAQRLYESAGWTLQEGFRVYRFER